MNEQNGTHVMTGLLDASYVQKDAKNEHFGYKYASATAVSETVAHALAKSNLFITSCEMGIIPIGENGSPLLIVRSQNSRGQETVAVLAVVKVSVMLSDGEKDYGPFDGLGMGSDRNDKAVMKAETAAWKYAISRASCTSWGDDPEADSTIDKELDQQPQPAEPDHKVAFRASIVKKEIEDALDASLEQGRERWSRATKEEPEVLRFIETKNPDWRKELDERKQKFEAENNPGG